MFVADPMQDDMLQVCLKPAMKPPWNQTAHQNLKMWGVRKWLDLGRALTILEREMAKNPAALAQLDNSDIEGVVKSLGAEKDDIVKLLGMKLFFKLSITCSDLIMKIVKLAAIQVCLGYIINLYKAV